MTVPTYTMLDGNKIPQLAFGSGTAFYKQPALEPVLGALKAHYTHIDTAQGYENEADVGDAIAQSGIPRDELFVNTKFFTLAEGQTVADSLQASLKKLKLDYVNMFLIHAPVMFEAPGRLEEVWKQMEGVKEAGLAKSIGVSNFRIKDLKRILEVAKYKPVVNQIEIHPYVYQQLLPLLKFQEEHGILTESFGGFTPLTKKTDGPLAPVLKDLSAKLNMTETQVLLKWLEQKGIVTVTTTTKATRLQEYLDTYTLPRLTDEEMKAIDDAASQLHFRAFKNSLAYMDQLE